MISNPNNDSMVFSKVSNCDHLGEAKNYIEILVWPFVVEGTSNLSCSDFSKTVVAPVLDPSKIYFFGRSYMHPLTFLKSAPVMQQHQRLHNLT